MKCSRSYLRPTCRSKPNNFVVGPREAVKIDLQVVSGDCGQRDEVDDGIPWI
jgi:hypothetical protein